MVNISPIRTEEDHEAALSRLAEIFQAEIGTPEGDERDILADLVELYEDKHYPIGLPDPISAIKFRMEQANLTPRDLVPFFGSRAKVSEVLSGKRAITMSMARALHQHLGIPADVLLQEPGASLPDTLPSWSIPDSPLRPWQRQAGFPRSGDLRDQAEEIITDLINRAGVGKLQLRCTARTRTGESTPRPMTMPSEPGAGRCWPKPGRDSLRWITSQGSSPPNYCVRSLK